MNATNTHVINKMPPTKECAAINCNRPIAEEVQGRLQLAPLTSNNGAAWVEVGLCDVCLRAIQDRARSH